MFDRCLILVKKSERVYNIMESRTPPHASRAHPYNYTTSQACCTCQTFDRLAARLLDIFNVSLSFSIYSFGFQTISNILSQSFQSLSPWFTIFIYFFAFCGLSNISRHDLVMVIKGTQCHGRQSLKPSLLNGTSKLGARRNGLDDTQQTKRI